MNATAHQEDARAPALPAAYAPFLPVFEQLTMPLRRLIGGQLVHFERALAHFLIRERHLTGELEGFDGLALRGDLAHILQSELLLRTEAPMEFVRRLSEAETLFLNKSFIDPGAHNAYRLVISCSPALLGHARLAVLSALFFFSRLATTRAAKLYWSFAPRLGDPVWFEGVTASSLRAFLEATSFRDVNAQDIEVLAASRPKKEEQEIPSEAGAAEVDWLIMAADPARSDVCGAAPRALCIQIEPPALGAARRARLSIVRQGRVGGRFVVAFPVDEQCVAALREPFAPRSTAATAPREKRGGGKRDKLLGWEPRWFVSPRQGQFLVRHASGLLVLVNGNRDTARFQSYWLELPDEAQLVGAEVASDCCYVALQGNIEGQQAIWFGDAKLAVPTVASREPIVFRMLQERRFPSSQLFSRQPTFALPGLDLSRGVRQLGCYSSLGQSFRSRDWSDANGGAFQIDKNAWRIVFDNGVYRAFWSVAHSQQTLRIEKHGRFTGVYKTPDLEFDARNLLGAMLDHASQLFCYSVEPGRWEVLSKSGVAGHLRTEAADQVVSLREKDGVFEARLWSDVRYGGDGGVRLEQHRNGEVMASRVQFNFEDIGGRIGKYEFLPDGSAWAMSIADSGDPLTLVRCRRKRKARDYNFAGADVEQLRADAIRLELSLRFD